jgi:predicted Zn-dependent protease
MMASHSRKDEEEADDMGVQLAAAAGYDPAALARCLDRLNKTVELFLGEKEKKSYFDDHPATPDRMADIAKVAASSPRASIPPILPNRDAYLRLLDGLIVGRNPEQGLFDEQNVFVHPDLNFRMEMPKDWNVFNTPNAFGAAEAKGKGQIVVGLAEGRDPEKAARQTLAIIQKEARKTPAETGSVDVNGHPGFHAVFAEKKTNLHLLWVAMGGKVFRIAGVAGDQWKEALRNSVLSLRPLKSDERAKVRVLRMRIETARAGESLNAFCERTGNAFKPDLTAILNSLDSQTLAQGQKLKIGRWEPYPVKR